MTFEFKQIRVQPLPWVAWWLRLDNWLFLLLALMSLAGVTFLD